MIMHRLENLSLRKVPSLRHNEQEDGVKFPSLSTQLQKVVRIWRNYQGHAKKDLNVTKKDQCHIALFVSDSPRSEEE